MKTQELRSGYTTGTCAAAAAKVAAVFVLTGTKPEEVVISMPGERRSCWNPVMAEEPELAGFWKVQKDSGDDPDVTNGVWVYARVSFMDQAEARQLRESGSGYWLEQYPALYLDGGIGIGRVTKPGLSCPVGHYAINPVPREMILAAVDQVCRAAGYEDGLLVEIAIPAGEALAGKTFNPRLGIEGGISVLGTTGIVRPMSEEALMETIRLDIHMKALDRKQLLIMTPGNYGETFLKETLGVRLGEAVVCSNFVAAAAEMIQESKIPRLLFVGHIGKLIKVASGARNTHSRYGDGRMETMEVMTRRTLQDTGYDQRNEGQAADFKEELCSRIRGANTTEEAAAILNSYGLAQKVLDVTAIAVKGQIEGWTKKKLETEVIVFSSACHVIGMTDKASAFLELWNRGQSVDWEGKKG